MKIAHFTFGLLTGGIETMLINIASYQCAMGEDVHIFIINDEVDPHLLSMIDPGVKVHFIGRKVGSKNLLLPLKVGWNLSKEGFDVIHLHHWRQWPFVISACKRKKVCLTYHDSLPDRTFYGMSYIPTLFAISNSVKNDLKEKLNRESTVVLNGIKVNDFRTRAFKSNVPSERPKIAILGRLVHIKKGQDLLIEAVNTLAERGFDNFEVDVIGDGPSEQFLRSLVDKYSLSDRIHFLGNIEQQKVKSILADYDLLIQPSRLDGFALTVAEAMVAGVPVLVPESTGPFEVIGYGKYGYSFVKGDSNSLADKIQELFSGGIDPVKTEKAYHYAMTSYNVENTARKYIEEYRKLQ